MKVLSSVTDPRLGGPQRRSLSVADRLEERGIDTVFLIPEGLDDFSDKAAARGFETHRVSMPRLRAPKKVRANLWFFGRFPGAVRAIRSLLKTGNIDVVHANASINFQTALAANSVGTPLTWHFNDTLTPVPVRQIASQLGRRWADEIVVAADAVHEFYFPPMVPSRTIYAPVDTEMFDPATVSVDETALRADLGIPQDCPVVGAIGNLNPIKGHDYFLRAIGKLSNDRTLAVPIVGKRLDSQRGYLRRLRSLRSSLGLEDTVEFVGFRSNVPELLSLFDVFVLPSVAEACPMVVLEAMAMAKPIVATFVGGVPEQLPGKEYGWVVPPKDPTALATAIGEALDSPSRRRARGRHARERAKEQFSLAACVERHEELYRSLAD
jgi:glycosyltransferase involved in cell wall biosynthesis